MFPQEEISIFWDELPCFEIDKVWEIVQKLSGRKRKQIKTIHRDTIPRFQMPFLRKGEYEF